MEQELPEELWFVGDEEMVAADDDETDDDGFDIDNDIDIDIDIDNDSNDAGSSSSFRIDDGFFDLCPGEHLNPQSYLIRKLDLLRTLDCTQSLDFSLTCVSVTEELASKVVATFQHYSSLQEHQQLQHRYARWRELVLWSCSPQSSEAFQSILLKGCGGRDGDGLDLFSHLTLASGDRIEDEMQMATAQTLQTICGSSQRLEQLGLQEMTISSNVMKVLSQGFTTVRKTGGATAASTNTTRTGCQNLKKLSFISVEFEEFSEQHQRVLEGKEEEEDMIVEDAIGHLARGLANNRSLNEFHISGKQLDQESLVKLFDVGITNHLTLTEVCISDTYYSAQAMKALARTLQAPFCKLVDLDLSGQQRYGRIDSSWTVMLADALNGNTSLRSLDLSHNGLKSQDLVILLRVLPYGCPMLESIDLFHNGITKLTYPLPLLPRQENNHNQSNGRSRLRRLDLDSNPILRHATEEDKLSLSRLVHSPAFPQLGYVCEDPVYSSLVGYDESSWYDNIDWTSQACLYARPPAAATTLGVKGVLPTLLALDWNRLGRILFLADNTIGQPSSTTNSNSNPTIPLSVWALVLEKVNQDLNEDDGEDSAACRRANVLYRLVQGPVFASRGSL